MKGVNTKEDVIKKAQEIGVEFIHMQFTDLVGGFKNVSITIEQLEKALNNEIMFDGSSIDGFVRIEESDMYLYPDISTFEIFPWKPSPGVEARLICDIYTADGKPFEGCPRYILKKALKEAADMGYSMFVGPECEFFLFKTDAEGKPTLTTHDNAGYFDIAPVDLGESARREMVLTLKAMGFEIEASHHEVGAGQHEIDFKYSEAVSAADDIMTFKHVVRVIAQKYGMHATFMPKPVFGLAGSGMHLNQSLFSGNTNAFYDESSEDGLSEIAHQYIAGLLKHAKGLCAVTNPNVNSYKRLVSGYEAPVYIAWSHKNRSPLIRVPAKRGASTRIELRNPDPSANPYLALALALTAGLEGIKQNMPVPEPINSNLYNMSTEEKSEKHIENLPETLKEAIIELQKDKLLMQALGSHARKQLIRAKLREWNSYRSRVTQWEVEQYLTTL